MNQGNKITYITIDQSYDTMVEFLESYYDLGLGQSEDLLSSLTRHAENGGYPFDLTLWDDYMKIAESKSFIADGQ